jgi:hypothetical protein
MFHRKYRDISVLLALALGLLTSATAAPAQVSISIGAAPICPYGYYDYAPTVVLRTATMDQIGSVAACS